MRCPSCGHDNREGASFCEDCGVRLVRRCPSCGAEARAGARFCDACGHRLVEPGRGAGANGAGSGSVGHGLEVEGGKPAAPVAGAAAVLPGPAALPDADPRSYTPRHLADQILRGRATIEGERRTVTVFFCDFRNSTALAERLGPEGMHT